MKPRKKNAPPEASPKRAKVSNKPEPNASQISLQGTVALFEDGYLAGRIVFGGARGIVFAKSPDGLMRQVADIIVGEVVQ